MRDRRPASVIGKDGLTGVLLDPLPQRPSGRDAIKIRLGDGRVISVPSDIVVADSDGTYLIPLGPADVDVEANASGSIRQEDVIPVLAEELVIDKKPRSDGWSAREQACGGA
jgi:hypothetical protein